MSEVVPFGKRKALGQAGNTSWMRYVLSQTGGTLETLAGGSVPDGSALFMPRPEEAAKCRHLSGPVLVRAIRKTRGIFCLRHGGKILLSTTTPFSSFEAEPLPSVDESQYLQEYKILERTMSIINLLLP